MTRVSFFSIFDTKADYDDDGDDGDDGDKPPRF